MLTEPIRLTIGGIGDASEDVTQVVEILSTDDDKRGWLSQRLPHFLQQGTLIVFVSTRSQTEELASVLNRSSPFPPGQKAEAIHGDKTQAERQETLVRAPPTWWSSAACPPRLLC